MNQTRPSDARLRLADREQVVMSMQSPEGLVDADHPVRVIWQVVCHLDLGGFYAVIRAREGESGRDTTDPRLLVALWLYARDRRRGQRSGIGAAVHREQSL